MIIVKGQIVGIQTYTTKKDNPYKVVQIMSNGGGRVTIHDVKDYENREYKKGEISMEVWVFANKGGPGFNIVAAKEK